MNIVKYKFSTKLISKADRQKFEGGILQAIQRARSGAAIRDIRLSGDQERIEDKILRTDREKRRALIGLSIMAIGRRFGAVGAIPQDIIKGLVDFVESFFSHLSIEEINLAFNMAASGELDADTSLYGRPINQDWLSRVLRAYKNRRNAALLAISNAEEDFRKLMSVDEVAEAEKRDQSFRKIIEDIINEFCRFCFSEDRIAKTDLSVYHLRFLQNINVLYVDPQEKKRSFKRSKAEIIRILTAEAAGAKTAVESVAIKSRIEAFQTDQADKTGRQAKIAINRIFRAWFMNLKREGVTPEIFEGHISDQYLSHEADLCAVRYVAHLTSFAGSVRDTKPLTRDQVEKLFEKIDEKITGIKITLK